MFLAAPDGEIQRPLICLAHNWTPEEICIVPSLHLIETVISFILWCCNRCEGGGFSLLPSHTFQSPLLTSCSLFGLNGSKSHVRDICFSDSCLNTTSLNDNRPVDMAPWDLIGISASTWPCQNSSVYLEQFENFYLSVVAHPLPNHSPLNSQSTSLKMKFRSLFLLTWTCHVLPNTLNPVWAHCLNVYCTLWLNFCIFTSPS